MMRPVMRRAQQASARQPHLLSDKHAAAADAPVPALPAAHAAMQQQQRRAISTNAAALRSSLMPHTAAAAVSSLAPPAALSAASSSSSSLLLTRRSFHSCSVRRSDEEDQAAKIAAHRERIRLKREADKAAAAAGTTAAPAENADEAPKPDEVSTPAPKAKPGKAKFSDEGPALDELGNRGPLRRMLHWLQDQFHSRLPASLSFHGLRSELQEWRDAKYGKLIFEKHAPSTPEYFAAQEAQQSEELQDLMSGKGAFDKKFVQQARPQPHKTVVKDADWISAALLKSKKEAEKASADAKKKEDDDAAEELTRIPDPAAYTGSTALMVVEQEGETLWTNRLADIDESLRGTIRVITRPILRRLFSIEPIANVRDKVKDRISEAKDEWENSQDPRVWQARDLQDKVTAQTETSLAMSEIKAADPNWNETEFLREMEEFMIPEVIGAYRVGDMKLLQSVVDGPATSQILMHLRTRAADKREWDPRILDIKGVDIVKASIAEDVPYIQLTFICQHINRDTHSETGEVIESEPKPGQARQATGTIATFYYSWALRKDYESKYYNWKIIDFQAQHIGLLA